MKYMDMTSFISVGQIKLLQRPISELTKLQADVNEALLEGWELAELKVTPEAGSAYAQMLKIRLREIEK